MKCLHMRTRLLGGQQPVDIDVQPMPLNDEGDKPEVIVTFDGATTDQCAVIGLRPSEAARLGRLLITTSEAAT